MRTRISDHFRFFVHFFFITALAFMGILFADMDNLQRYVHFDDMKMASAIIRSIISWIHLWIAIRLFKRLKDTPMWLKIVLAVPSFLLAIFCAGFLVSLFVEVEG